jgi:hypothetical protein
MLRDLKGLLDDGIITGGEFLDKKNELLQGYDGQSCFLSIRA